MLTSVCLNHLRTAGQCLRQQARRNIGSTTVLAQKAEDPIQQLFLQKVKEFTEQKKGGKITDVPPESQRSLDLELNRLQKQYKAAEIGDMTKFPDFKFADAGVEMEAVSSKKDMEPTDLPL